MTNLKRVAIYTAATFLTVAAILINAPHLYYMAALLFVLPWTSYVVGMFALRDLVFERETPGSGWEGETATFHVVVRSRARLPRLFLQAWDSLPAGLSPESEEPVFFNAAANSTTKVPYRVELTKRGAYNIETMHVTALDPLGIYAFTKTVRHHSELLVYPVPQVLPEFELSGSERFGYRDMPIAATRGSGVDPDGVREYVPGDPLRRMHWKSTARTGKLNVIEFEESHTVNIVLALDVQRGQDVGEGRQSTFEYLVRTAASLAQLAVRQGASVRLVMGSQLDAADSAGRGTEHLFTVLAGLARAEATDDQPLSESLVARVGPLPPGTTLIALTASTDADLAGALAHYSIAGVRVMAFYVDAHSFRPDLRLPERGEQRRFVEQLFMVQAAPYLVRRQEQGLIKPEPIHDVRQFAEN